MEKVDRPIYFCIGEKDKRKVKTKEVTNEQKFRFGGGKVMVAIQEVSAPVIIGKKHYNLQWFVVNARIPLLWGKESMKKIDVLLDLHQDRAKITGEWVDLETIS